MMLLNISYCLPHYSSVAFLGQLKSSVLHVKDWLQDTLTPLSQTTTFASLIPSVAPHWQHRSGLSKGSQPRESA